jgi:hypothetical protein
MKNADINVFKDVKRRNKFGYIVSIMNQYIKCIKRGVYSFILEEEFSMNDNYGFMAACIKCSPNEFIVWKLVKQVNKDMRQFECMNCGRLININIQDVINE